MPTSLCAPADFEQHSAIILGCNELLPFHPQAMVDLITALVDRIPIIGIVDSEDQRKHVIATLCDWGLPAHLLHFVSLPVKGMWVRDYGPAFVKQEDQVVILDAEYLEAADRPVDDAAPTELAALLRVPVVPVPLTVEGGNIISNGQGVAITTTSLVHRNKARGYDEAKVRQLMREYYGIDQLVILNPLLSETTGHIDMYATFVSQDTVVVGKHDPKIDPVNADVLDYAALQLAKVKTKSGMLKVERIPMPSNRGSIFRTYTNVIYANGRLLVPTYGPVDPEGEQAAVETYRRLLPGWDIRTIDASSLILKRGALRCVSIKVPWMEHIFEPPKLKAKSRPSTLAGSSR